MTKVIYLDEEEMPVVKRANAEGVQHAKPVEIRVVTEDRDRVVICMTDAQALSVGRALAPVPAKSETEREFERAVNAVLDAANHYATCVEDNDMPAQPRRDLIEAVKTWREWGEKLLKAG